MKLQAFSFRRISLNNASFYNRESKYCFTLRDRNDLCISQINISTRVCDYVWDPFSARKKQNRKIIRRKIEEIKKNL